METQYLIKNKIIQFVLFVLLLLAIVFVFGVYKNVVPQSSLFNIGLVFLLIALLFSIIKLEIKIENEVFYYRLFPFQIRYKQININDIVFIEKLPYTNFIFAGLGIRKLNDGWAYFIDGEAVLKLHLSKGTKLYFTVNKIDIKTQKK